MKTKIVEWILIVVSVLLSMWVVLEEGIILLSIFLLMFILYPRDRGMGMGWDMPTLDYLRENFKEGGNMRTRIRLAVRQIDEVIYKACNYLLVN